jgi:hypothetical protein
MKRCTKCNQTYDDDGLNFCLADGAPLVLIDSEPTVVIPRPPAKKKSRLLIWLGLGVLAIGVGVVALAALLLYRNLGDDPTGGSTQNTTNRQTAAASPKPIPSPSPTPTTADEESSNEQPTDNEDADEVTPILWETAAAGFKGKPGTTYTFECPAGGTAGSIWGSDIYTDYSSICTAAVHTGAITLEEGGVITLEYRPGRQIYGSTIRNEIKSNTSGEHSRSFVIRSDKKN